MIRPLLVVVLLSLSVVQQIFALTFPLHNIVQDTVIQNDTLSITPYFVKTQTYALGNFAVVKPDKIAFQTYAGLNVLNTLRGHVPNISIGPNTSTSSPGLRSTESLMVIDGLPLNSSILNYYNLNSFEYQNIYALSSGNALALYGGTGSNGGFFLQSKTGENFSRPTFEFNSSPTLLWAESEQSFMMGDSETTNQALFTNAVAYKQDFGALDTRVSYTYSLLPEGGTDTNIQSDYHSIRINTGFNITSKFKARLILDNFYTKEKSSQTITFPGSPILLSNETIRKNLQGNLQLQFKPLDWLSFSSQSSLAKIENNGESFYQTLSTTDRKQNRTFANLYASVNKSLSSDFSFTTFFGYQYEKQKQEGKSGYGTSGSFSENKTSSILGGVGLQFKDYLFSDFNYRQDYFSIYASDNDNAPTYSINTSFIFSEALSTENSWFNFGKLRASIGKNSVAIHQGYPDEWQGLGSFTNYYPNRDLHASAKQMFETGVDLGFAQNRITFSASYFSDHHEEMVSLTPVPSGANWTSYLLTNLWTLDTKGWEFVLGGTPIKKSNFIMDTKLIWSTYKTALKNSNDINTGNNSLPIIRDRNGFIIIDQNSGNPSQGISLGNPNPDWIGSLLNQITFKNFFTSFLIDVREGGTFYSMNYSSGFPTFSTQDGSMAKLRDLSFGYRLSSSVLDKLNIHEAQLSVSGRNLWTIYSKSESEVEGSFSSTPQKSASLSLTLMF